MSDKLSSFFFNYSNRYRSGSFDMRNVVRWHSEGESYYLVYKIFFADGGCVGLDGDEFYRFEKCFRELKGS